MTNQSALFDNLEISTENIRYLLWRYKEIERERWADHLGGWLQEENRFHCQELLDGAKLMSAGEGQRLLANFHGQYTEEQLFLYRLVEVEAKDVLLENVKYLTDELGDVNHREFASAIDVSHGTVSRWRGRSQRPNRNKQKTILLYFGFLPEKIDLEADALFLYPGPLTHAQRRVWLHEQIDKLDSIALNEIYPALKKLFSQS